MFVGTVEPALCVGDGTSPATSPDKKSPVGPPRATPVALVAWTLLLVGTSEPAPCAGDGLPPVVNWDETCPAGLPDASSVANVVWKSMLDFLDDV